MSFKDKLEQYKQKKDLIDELDFYKSIISKKLENKNFKSALEKIESAIILIKENQQFFNLNIELSEFENIKEEIISKIKLCQKVYIRRYNNLLKESLTESNIENFLKLLVMLKGEVDEKLDDYNLENLSARINRYFIFLKRLYIIISSYRVLHYHGASNKILEFAKEIKSENYPNIKALIFYIYQDLLNNQFSNFSKQYDKLSIIELSEKLAINQDSLSNFLDIIMKDPNCPIKKYNIYTQEVIFSR
ncbi:MAG: hypothetical protein ACFE8M_00030 [Candidatus Hermodarchaeota archaeon]